MFISHLTSGNLLQTVGKEDLENHSNAGQTLRAVFQCLLGLRSWEFKNSRERKWELPGLRVNCWELTILCMLCNQCLVEAARKVAWTVYKPTLCWAASKGTWPAGQGKWFSPSALMGLHLEWCVHSMILCTYIYKLSFVYATVDVFLSGTQFFPDFVPDAKTY